MKVSKAFLSALLIFLAVVFTAPGGVDAGDYLAPKMPLEDPVVVDDSFQFDFKFNGWLAQMNVNASNSALGLQTSMFLSLSDILGNLDWMVPLGADLRWGNVGFLPDVIAMKLSGATSTPRGRLFSTADVSMKMMVANMPLYYRVVDQDDLQVDLLAGARFLWVDLNTTLSGGVLGTVRGPTRATTSVQNWNAIGGVRLQQNLNEKFFYTIYADIGAGNSDLTWQAQGDIGYRLKENVTTSLGYRYLTFDQSQGPTDVSLTSSGVIISTTVEF